MSTWLMKFLCGFYFGLFVICLVERNIGRAVYWFGAGLLTVGVLMMK